MTTIHAVLPAENIATLTGEPVRLGPLYVTDLADVQHWLDGYGPGLRLGSQKADNALRSTAGVSLLLWLHTRKADPTASVEAWQARLIASSEAEVNAVAEALTEKAGGVLCDADQAGESLIRGYGLGRDWPALFRDLAERYGFVPETVKAFTLRELAVYVARTPTYEDTIREHMTMARNHAKNDPRFQIIGKGA
jgi:hypothetical protein